VQIIEIDMPGIEDYLQAMKHADQKAEEILGDYMLLSWYDRDRDFESPQHASECHQDSAVPGYVDYGIYHGATLKIDFEQGRFVFFYMPVDL
ncbi:MAG: AF1514 family protein, partial [Gammaproteobacteria bacterium]|nr:AF1514 family protein [Gammaproteobacteria bacterium]